MRLARLFLVYGATSGAVIIAGMLLALWAMGTTGTGNMVVGYLIMLVALSTILIGVKSYRDTERGGVIGFWPALTVGLGIALTASLAYVLVWEGYMFATHYTFMDHVTQVTLAGYRSAGVTGAAYAHKVAEMETARAQYANPLIRLPMTFAEIFPVGLLMSLISAALLRNPRFLPARQRVG